MTPNVKCPNCGKVGCVQISGFASELATREKYCRFCNEKFYVHIITATSKEKEIRDGKVSELKEKIDLLYKQQCKVSINHSFHDNLEGPLDNSMVYYQWL